MFCTKWKKLLEEKQTELLAAESRITQYEEEFKDVFDIDKVINERKLKVDELNGRIVELNLVYQSGLAIHEKLKSEIELYQESLELGSYGMYEPQFSFDTAEDFKTALEGNYARQKALVKSDGAVVCYTEWTVGGSRAEGKKMVSQYKKLMLFAFNGECDGIIAKVKWNNVNKIRERIIKAFEAINRLGSSNNVFITQAFLDLKLEELALTYEYEKKKYDEKEEQRMIREQMREEEKVQRDLEKAQKEAEEEERRFERALERARRELGEGLKDAVFLEEQIKDLERKLSEAHEKKDRAIALAQLTKVGHIYIISNIGSFGADVYKIGMTRRLDPLDRVRELGDASVPFQFDVHAVIYSENAPQLEYNLHKEFNHRRLNRINGRKEFFHVTLDEIEAFVKKHTNADIQFTKLAEAKEYRETRSLIEGQVLIGVEKEPSKFPGSLI